MATTTPLTITDTVKSFCNQVVPGVAPLHLAVTPELGAVHNDCFPTVQARIARDGGTLQHGWIIWEWPNVLFEAEFHAVWCDTNGKFHDLNPHEQAVDKILFLPDSQRVYQGRQVNNVRRPISNAPSVRAYIQAMDSQFEFENRGERADQHGRIDLTPEEQDEYRLIRHQVAHAFMGILSAPAAPGRNDPCVCGSGRKFKKCHGA